MTPKKILEALKQAKEISLFLDYDGTLVPLAEKPDQALPPPLLLSRIENLCHLPGTYVAVVSGRSIADLQSFLPLTGLYLVGVHGLVFVFPRGEIFFRGGEEKDLRAKVELFTHRLKIFLAGKTGFFLEKKNIAVAVHYRQADPSKVKDVLCSLCREFEPLLKETGFTIKRGKKVLEFCPLAANKGDAVNYLLSLHPQAVPVYLGDDETDEDAFRVLSSKGYGILVAKHPKKSASCCRLRDPQEVALFLDELIKFKSAYTCEKDPGGENIKNELSVFRGLL